MELKRPAPRRIVATFCGMLLLVPIAATVAPRQAHATLLGDSGIWALVNKEFPLDALAWMVKRAAVAALVQSSLNWINSGFKGSPAFVTNLRENLLIVGDTVAAEFFDELSGTIIDSPFQDEIALAIRTGYYLSTGGTFYIQNPFTLSQYSRDPRAFLGGEFSQGGFSAFFSTITNCQNNPYCAYQLALGELNSRVSAGVGREKTLYDWAQGFKSFRGNCDKAMPSQASGTTLPAPGVALSKTEPCLEAGILTPGALIAPRANEVLGAGERELITADEINEVVGALFAQLVNQAFGSNGLVSVSAPTVGGGRPYLDQAVASSQSTGGGIGVGGGNTQSGQVSQDDILAYMTNWQKIGTAAEAALGYCDAAFVQSAKTSATNATVRATNALASTDSGSRSTASTIITAAEVQQSRVDAAESGSSLYAQLVKITTDRKCPSS